MNEGEHPSELAPSVDGSASSVAEGPDLGRDPVGLERLVVAGVRIPRKQD